MARRTRLQKHRLAFGAPMRGMEYQAMDGHHARDAIEEAAKCADWDRKRLDRDLGSPCLDYSGTQLAGVEEVSLDRRNGAIRVCHIGCVIDAAIAVQPDNVIVQTQSSIVYGLGMALAERITIPSGTAHRSLDSGGSRRSRTPRVRTASGPEPRNIPILLRRQLSRRRDSTVRTAG